MFKHRINNKGKIQIPGRVVIDSQCKTRRTRAVVQRFSAHVKNNLIITATCTRTHLPDCNAVRGHNSANNQYSSNLRKNGRINVKSKKLYKDQKVAVEAIKFVLGCSNLLIDLHLHLHRHQYIEIMTPWRDTLLQYIPKYEHVLKKTTLNMKNNFISKKFKIESHHT